jgi:hypothetical protein
MKTTEKSQIQKPFYKFEFPEFGYDIAVIPHSEEYTTMLKCEACGPAGGFIYRNRRDSSNRKSDP